MTKALRHLEADIAAADDENSAQINDAFHEAVEIAEAAKRKHRRPSVLDWDSRHDRRGAGGKQKIVEGLMIFFPVAVPDKHSLAFRIDGDRAVADTNVDPVAAELLRGSGDQPWARNDFLDPRDDTASRRPNRRSRARPE